jgi:hypothetical protein
LGSFGSSIADHRSLRRNAPWNSVDRGSTNPGEWTVPANAGAPAATQATSVAWSAPLRRPWCGGVESAVRIGALDGGRVAGAPDGDTHAMVERNDVADHPAAGEVVPWHETQEASRMGAISVSKTGGAGALVRSTEQPAKRGKQASARRACDVLLGDTAPTVARSWSAWSR